MPPSPPLRFDAHGAERHPFALTEPDCLVVEEVLSALPQDMAGVRIGSAPALSSMLAVEGKIGRVAATVLGRDARPVRALLFDKTAATNWSLGWHQDRTIVVRERHAVDGFGPWSVKAGLVQVEPPIEVLTRMVTVRVHLDPVDATNAPLRIVPGSHRLGRIPEAQVEQVVTEHGEALCLAERGDLWLYATTILHGSRAASPPRRRRVLQVDYAAAPLPPPLVWRGL